AAHQVALEDVALGLATELDRTVLDLVAEEQIVLRVLDVHRRRAGAAQTVHQHEVAARVEQVEVLLAAVRDLVADEHVVVRRRADVDPLVAASDDDVADQHVALRRDRELDAVARVVDDVVVLDPVEAAAAQADSGAKSAHGAAANDGALRFVADDPVAVTAADDRVSGAVEHGAILDAQARRTIHEIRVEHCDATYRVAARARDAIATFLRRRARRCREQRRHRTHQQRAPSPKAHRGTPFDPPVGRYDRRGHGLERGLRSALTTACADAIRPGVDLSYAKEDEEFRRELRAWLRKHLPKRGELDGGENLSYADPRRVQTAKAWQRTLYKAGYVAIGWPKEYGGQGASIVRQTILNEELVL